MHASLPRPCCPPWRDAHRTQASELMQQWAPIDIADALELLSPDPDFQNEEVGAAWGCVVVVAVHGWLCMGGVHGGVFMCAPHQLTGPPTGLLPTQPRRPLRHLTPPSQRHTWPHVHACLDPTPVHMSPPTHPPR